MELLRSWKHPEEVCALLRYKLGAGGAAFCKPERLNYVSSQLRKCYEYLDKTSRTYAAMIRVLDEELRDVVCIFYLVLRALDTIEDDMTIPYGEKMTLLPKFYTFLEDPSWNYMKSKDKYCIVLENFTTISSQFRLLKPVYRNVISDVCRKMGIGMTVYLTKSVASIQQWDEYSHYVGGLVGLGVSQMFSASELEDRLVSQQLTLSNSMGIFLQKINTIRDYHEDVMQGRQFWPKEVWSKNSEKLVELSEPERIDDAISCLNELITNALSHIPDALSYLSLLRNQSNFHFWAIPQVMAIATLERCYSNPQVFRGVVKVRKGEAVWLMMKATNMDNVKAIFSHYLKQIESKIPYSDPSARVTRQVIEVALSTCNTSQVLCNICYTARVYQLSTTMYLTFYLFVVLLLAIIYRYGKAMRGAI